MRYLHVISSVNPAQGGPIEGIKQLAAVAVRKGHHVEVACLDGPDEPWLGEFPLPLHVLGTGKGGYSFSPKLVPWLQENKGRFDAIVVNGLWQYNSLGTWRALRGGGPPYFVFTHGMLDPWFNEAYPLKKLRKNLYWAWGMYPVLRDAAAVLFTSEEEKILARKSFRPYKVNERVVQYGTPGPKGDLDAMGKAFVDSRPELSGKRVLLYLSRIHEKKGCDLLVNAFARWARKIPELVLVMAGPDKTGLTPKLQAQAAALGIADRIVWPGMLTGDAKWGAYKTAEAFVLPSHQENFGIVVAEALACGTPVVISDKINIWREIEAAGAGIVEPDDQAGTDRALDRWFALNADERHETCAKARQCFEANFEIERAADSLIEALKNGRDID
ncbi:MAG: glycosyltransferase [Armatimonadetes bacterium]|nr:glycosyltransferase [Armatimonadota bacterium]